MFGATVLSAGQTRVAAGLAERNRRVGRGVKGVCVGGFLCEAFPQMHLVGFRTGRAGDWPKGRQPEAP